MREHGFIHLNFFVVDTFQNLSLSPFLVWKQHTFLYIRPLYTKCRIPGKELQTSSKAWRQMFGEVLLQQDLDSTFNLPWILLFCKKKKTGKQNGAMQHDNDPKHNSKSTKDWLRTEEWEVLVQDYTSGSWNKNTCHKADVKNKKNQNKNNYVLLI